MLARLAARGARARAARTTLVFKHPIRAVRIVRGRRDPKREFVRERWAFGLGAAALMLPVGIWLGRRMAG